MARSCTCGADISARPEWQSLCYPCWRRANPHRAPGAGRMYATGQRPPRTDRGAYYPDPPPSAGPQPSAMDAEAVRATAAANARLTAEVEALRRTLASTQSALRVSQMQAADLLRRTRGDDSASGLNGHLPKLIRLCHPDRHAGSAMANEVTAWLLSLRR